MQCLQVVLLQVGYVGRHVQIPSQEEGCSEGGPELLQERLQLLLDFICKMVLLLGLHYCSYIFMHSPFQEVLVN